MDSTTKIPGYKILDKVGEGGMATVYLAIQVSLARTVALKIITPARIADPSAKERFLKEGKIIAKLNHPNIVTVHDIGHYESLYYMAIEYVGGGSLTKRIAQGLRPDEAVEITKQVAKALGYAHKHGFIHRDVKPANILFREDGTIVLSDFGIAKGTTSETVLTIMGATIGTPDYMSPEQLTGKRLDSRSDLYSIGVVLYEMLTYEKPFKGPDAFSTAICHLSSPIPRLPEQFTLYQILIERLLAKDPNDRFDNAEQLIEALEHTDTTQRLAGDSKRTKRKTIWLKAITKSNNQAKSGNGDGGRAHFLRWFAVFGGVSLTIVAAVLWLKEPDISPQTQLLIDLLLSQAERQIATSHLTEPDGDNAYQNYQYVLKLHPNNKQAVNGLQKIADRFEQQALSKQRSARLGEALSLTARGLSVDPEHEGLLTLQKELTQQVEKQRQQQKIAQLLFQAEQQLKTSRVTQPAGENALHSYREVLGLDPQNRQALSGLQKIADRFQQLARSKLHEVRPEEGLKLIVQGLAVVPHHKGLLALQLELSRRLETQQQQRTINQFLAQAEREFKASQLMEPANDNAYTHYRQILEIDPDNAKAKAGLVRIADQYEQFARQYQTQGTFQESLEAIGHGLQVVPTHKKLLSLRETVNTQINTRRERLREVGQLFDRAEHQFQASRLIEPEEDNAQATFRKILELDPGNAKAEAGLERIADRFEQIARQRQTQGAFQESLAAIERGLEAVPTHKQLQSLRKAVNSQIEAQAKRRREIEQLLAQAERQLQARRLTEPAHDNAYASYRRILELDPDNTEAQAGLERIAAQYEQLARRHKAEGAFQKSLTAIERGLQVAPAHQGLQNLRAAVANQIEERNRQQLEEARRKQELTHLLSLAGQQLEAGQLIEPSGNNAYESYQQVQTIDPRNASAFDGLDKIADRIANNAQSERQQGQLKEGLSQVQRGLKAFPNSARLQELRADIAQELGQQRRQQEIAALLAKADQQFNVSKFTQPEHDNAYATYRSVLALDPQNRDALAGLQAIAKHHEELARRELDEGRPEDALLAIAEGLKANDENENLLKLRQQITRRLEDQARRERRLHELQAKAQAQMAATRYTEPKGDNAYETFQQILALDAGHAEALAGLAKIAGVLEQRAREDQRTGKYKQSLSLIDKAFEVQPQHRELIMLRQAVEVQLKKQRQKQEIDNLLAKANHQFTASRLTQPDGDNALESYRQVLKLSPKDGRAMAGIQHIANRHLLLAQDMLGNGKLRDSLTLIDRGLSLVPKHPGLKSLKDTVTQQLQDQQRQEELESLLATAEEQFAASRLTTPKEDNAYETYTQVLQLSPQDNRALDGLQRIADRYLQLSQNHLEKGDLDKSLVFCDRGLTVDPKYSQLLTLRAEVQHRREVETQLRQTLRPLLAKASQQLAALHLTEPEGNNAHETYLQVLEMDKDNQQAEDGLQKIADYFQTFAKNKQRSGDLRGGLKLVELGLTVDPAHSELLRLHQEIISALNEKIQNERKLQQLFETARQQLEAGHFIQPPDNNASTIYRQILAIDPQNSRAQEGLKTITEYCLSRAQVIQQNGDLQQSLSLVQQGLEINPNHPGLLSLQNSLTNQLESAEHKKRHHIFGTH